MLVCDRWIDRQTTPLRTQKENITTRKFDGGSKFKLVYVGVTLYFELVFKLLKKFSTKEHTL